MIYSFDYPHKPRTVCGPGCPICDPGGANQNAWMTDQHGNMIPLQPLFIIREATREEHTADLIANGGNGYSLPSAYYYEVSTD